MRRRHAIALVAAAAVLPRLGVLLRERGAILGGLTEKSDRFAQTLVESGTFGFLPDRPSAYTQPLYAWFLSALYWVIDRHWVVVGLAHLALATATALLVYAIGIRLTTRSVALTAALIATLEPFLIWHDMHLNREVLDGILAAALVLAALIAAERRSLLFAALAGGLAGAAILANTRLAALVLVVAVFAAWGRSWRRAVPTGAIVVACAAVVVMPWVIRNAAVVGCPVLTTDARALWKANNPETRQILARGGWLDDVPEPKGGPPWPELAADRTLGGDPTEVDECEQVDYYQGLVFSFWRDRPAEKARLVAQATAMLWSPRFSGESLNDHLGSLGSLARSAVQPAWMMGLYVLAIAGATLVRRRFLWFAVALLGYQTLAAGVFAGTVRYRAPWDFLLALLAAHALAWLAARARARWKERA